MAIESSKSHTRGREVSICNICSMVVLFLCQGYTLVCVTLRVCVCLSVCQSVCLSVCLSVSVCV